MSFQIRVLLFIFFSFLFAANVYALSILRETEYAKAKGVITGRYLGKKLPKAKILVVMSKDWKKNEREKAMLEGLKKGLGKSAVKIIPDVPEITMPKDSGATREEIIMMMPMMELMKAKDFDALIEKHADCNVIVSFVGLPRRDTQAMKLWKIPANKRPKVVLLGGDMHSLKKAIEAKMITAIVAYKPDPNFDVPEAPADPQKAFDHRFLLITVDNLAEITKKYPKGLFAK